MMIRWMCLGRGMRGFRWVRACPNLHPRGAREVYRYDLLCVCCFGWWEGAAGGGTWKSGLGVLISYLLLAFFRYFFSVFFYEG